MLAIFLILGYNGLINFRGKKMKVKKSVLDLVGNTPMVEISRFSKAMGLESPLLAKLEKQNPAGSVKDRIALYMIESAEKKGLLTTGGTIIEPTSGNTGIGIAMVAAAKGYKAVLVMPSNMSVERQKLIKAYGAEVVLTDASLGMKGAVDKAVEINQTTPNSIIASQFSNPDNPLTHVHTTGVEIYEDTDGKVDVFVAGIGSAGTIVGVSNYLKSKKEVEIVGVEPASSPLITTGKAGAHGIQGIGANFVPSNYDADAVDQVVTVTDIEAIEASKMIARTEGLFVGISSGAALSAAAKLAQRPEYQDKTIVVLLPDTGERYLSTALVD